MTVLSLTNPVNGTTGDANLIASNNAAILSVINGSLDNSNLAAGAAIGIAKLAGYPTDATKFLRGDGNWATVTVPTVPAPATTLPGSPSDLQQAILTDSTTVPTYAWMFQWSATASKWFFVGGSPAYQFVETQQAVSSATSTFGDFATVGPTFTVPRAGNYLVRFGANYGGNGSNSSSWLGVTIAGATPAIPSRQTLGGTSVGLITMASEFSTGAISNSSLLKLQGADGNTGSRTSWAARYISVTPIYVT